MFDIYECHVVHYPCIFHLQSLTTFMGVVAKLDVLLKKKKKEIESTSEPVCNNLSDRFCCVGLL